MRKNERVFIHHVFIHGVESKRCSANGEIVPLTSFHNNKKSSDGLESQCKDCARKWRQDHPEVIRERNKRRSEYRKQWRNANRDRERATARRANHKRHKRPEIRLSKNMSGGIYRALKLGYKANRHWEEYVDYTMKQLKEHIEKQFVRGMTWDNYGRGGWNIDHIIPITAFNYDSPNDLDFKRCWSLNNLRPLWETENIKKSDTLSRPFQPALKLGVML